MLVYHGTILCHAMDISNNGINLNKGNRYLDFGKGFYVTTSYEQAVSFVPNSVKRNIKAGNIPSDFDVSDGQISVFRFRSDADLLIRTFEDANLDWLHFVAANRNRDLVHDLYQSFEGADIVGGKIANDNTSRVLAGYVTGLFGTPGSDLADAFAIQSLLPNRLKDQFCFRTSKSIQALEFIRSDRYGDIR